MASDTTLVKDGRDFFAEGDEFCALSIIAVIRACGRDINKKRRDESDDH
jgi:hypothetical protein